MKNLYEYFEVPINATTKNILEAYETKISRYFKINELSDKHIYEIKMLKVGLYILTNNLLRKKYNKLIEMEYSSTNEKPIKIKNTKAEVSFPTEKETKSTELELFQNTRTWQPDCIIPTMTPSYEVADSLRRPACSINRRLNEEHLVFSR
jgi:hypothetical protein